MLIDTHAHIFLDKFSDDIDEVISRSVENDVQNIFMPNIDSSSIKSMLDLEEKYPGHCYAMIGLHPCSVDENYKQELEIVEEWLERRSFVAIGEMGTDLYWDTSKYEYQKKAFEHQAALALNADLPIVIHCRNSIQETIELVSKVNDRNLKGVFHCFTGNIDQAKAIIDFGFYLGIGGIATFKNGGLDNVLKQIDISHLVLETDSPYLAPEPNRGKRNEPAYVKHVAEKVAMIKDMSIEDVATITSNNALKLYGRH